MESKLEKTKTKVYYKSKKTTKDEKINMWLNKKMYFGKYKDCWFSDILKKEDGVKYLLYISSLENVNESLKYIILKLIDNKF